MADVTDAAFRRIIAKYGKPPVMFTEFVSCDGLCSEKGRPNLLHDLIYHETERPIVAQIFGDKPENFRETAELLAEMKFDGIDINMGCPTKTVVRQGSGAALIKTPELAKKIIRATKEGAGDLPVSVKTRIGFSKIEIDEWMEALLEAKPAAITLHLRTRKEMSKVDAHWEIIHRAAELAKGTGILVLGNGDVDTLEHAEDLALETGIDGVMLGRAIFGNPWLFNRSRKTEDVSFEERLEVALEHARDYEELFSGKKSFLLMRKHLKAYVSGFEGAKDFRIRLEDVNNFSDTKSLVNQLRESYISVK